jgi:MoxR-like ATPase
MAHELPAPFFVVATQNPHEQLGTYALPESQLDRFLMRIELGYPERGEERVLLQEGAQRRRGVDAVAELSADAVLQLQQDVSRIHVAAPLLDYVQDLVAASRRGDDIRLGLSPRAGQGLVQAARAWALLRGGEFVTPDDVQNVWPAVAAHRLEARQGIRSGVELAGSLLAAVPVPD